MSEYPTCAIGFAVNKGRQHLDSRRSRGLQPRLQPRPHPGLDLHQLLLTQPEGQKCLVHLRHR